jgi:pimeloyl-ACP methyl ester carboxylesterase
MKKLNLVKLFLVLLFTFACAGFNPINAQPLNEIGVVLLHGKGGDTRWVDPLGNSLMAVKVQVLVPDMPWHRNRIYDKTFEDSLQEINAHVETLKKQGAKKVFVAGHSLGAVVAAGYGATHDNISGIILLAPGHFVSMSGFHANFKADLARAEQMISEGKGDVKANFGDSNMGRRDNRWVTAKIYHSWVAPNGPADFVVNMTRLKKNIAVLYVAGERDNIPGTKDRSYVFDRVPANKGNYFTIIPSDHLSVPADSAAVVIEWLRKR